MTAQKIIQHLSNYVLLTTGRTPDAGKARVLEGHNFIKGYMQAPDDVRRQVSNWAHQSGALDERLRSLALEELKRTHGHEALIARACSCDQSDPPLD